MPIIVTLAAAPEVAAAGVTLADVAAVLTAAGTVLAAGQAIKDSVGNLMDELGI